MQKLDSKRYFISCCQKIENFNEEFKKKRNQIIFIRVSISVLFSFSIVVSFYP